MRPIARLGDTHVCPKCGVNAIVTATSSDLQGRGIAVVGSVTSCGATIITGSSQGKISGQPIAYLGSRTDHGGVITTGSGLVKIEP